MIYHACNFELFCAVLLNARRPSFISVALLILSAVGAFAAFVVFRMNLGKKARNTKKLINKIGRESEDWDYDEICERAKDTFFAFHKMLSSGDKTHITAYVTEALFADIDNRFILSAVKKRNVDSIKLREIAPADASDYEDDALDSVWVYIRGDSTNCGIDAQVDARFAKSSKNAAKGGEYWQFVREKGNWLLNNIVYR